MFGTKQAITDIRFEMSRFVSRLDEMNQKLDDLDRRLRDVSDTQPTTKEIKRCLMESLDDYKNQVIGKEVKVKKK